jgi:hypothetical protein
MKENEERERERERENERATKKGGERVARAIAENIFFNAVIRHFVNLPFRLLAVSSTIPSCVSSASLYPFTVIYFAPFLLTEI